MRFDRLYWNAEKSWKLTMVLILPTCRFLVVNSVYFYNLSNIFLKILSSNPIIHNFFRPHTQNSEDNRPRIKNFPLNNNEMKNLQREKKHNKEVKDILVVKLSLDRSGLRSLVLVRILFNFVQQHFPKTLIILPEPKLFQPKQLFSYE